MDSKMDSLLAGMSKVEQIQCKVTHLFTKGLYTRRIHMPAKTTNSKGEEVETIVLSKIHGTQHPYFITKGRVAVYNKVDDFLGILTPGFIDITVPGTRRLLHVIENTEWTTCHPLPYITGEENFWSDEEKAKLVERIEKDIILERNVSLESVKEIAPLELINFCFSD